MPTGPAPPSRWQHSAVYAPAHGRMIVYGGKLPTTPYGTDVWVLTGAHGKGVTPQWIRLNPGGVKPAGRHEHTAIYDSASDRMVVFGGHTQGGSPFAADLWVLEHASGVGGTPRWSALTPSGPAPASREWHTAVYDAASRRMIVFGGLGSDNKSHNDTWVLENATGLGGAPRWIELAPGGTRPAPRVAHSAVYDAATNSMVVFGGSGDTGFSGFLADTWRLENANGLGGSPRWRQVVAAGTTPPARENHIAIADGKGGMIVFGGWTTVRYFSDSWWLKNVFGGGPITWIKLRTRGKVPQAREAAAAVFDPATRRVILFGGSFSPPGGVPPSSRCDSGSCTHDLWVLPR